jgi:hypothetical protein
MNLTPTHLDGCRARHFARSTTQKFFFLFGASSAESGHAFRKRGACSARRLPAVAGDSPSRALRGICFGISKNAFFLLRALPAQGSHVVTFHRRDKCLPNLIIMPLFQLNAEVFS